MNDELFEQACLIAGAVRKGETIFWAGGRAVQFIHKILHFYVHPLESKSRSGKHKIFSIYQSYYTAEYASHLVKIIKEWLHG